MASAWHGAARTRDSMESAVASIGSLAATSYGPGGRAKVIRANAHGGALTVTSSSHRLFSAVKLEHPVALVLVELLAARQARGADGGLFTMLLATGLLRGALATTTAKCVNN